jgi:hypothetical protein
MSGKVALTLTLAEAELLRSFLDALTICGTSVETLDLAKRILSELQSSLSGKERRG